MSSLAHPAGRPGWLAARAARFDAATIVWIGAAAVLAFLVLAPILRLILASFQNPDSGTLGLANYIAAYSSERRLIALGTSLLYAIAVTIVSIGFAVPIAWAIARTDM